MDLERLSTNIIYIIDELLKNQKLVDYIGHNGNFPISKHVNPIDIAPRGRNERILPYPFNEDYAEDVRTQLHIYYPNFQFVNNGYVNKNIIAFDVVVHKSIWLVMEGDKKLIRPYQIVKHVVDSLKDKSIEGVGKIHFIEGVHTLVNKQYEGVRIVAKITDF